MLHVVKGTKKPPARILDSRPSGMLQCNRCGCREMIETRIGAVLLDGKVSRGTRAMVCAGCHRKGERVVVA